MADITQKLGFDTSGGVTALNNLKSAIDGVTESLKRLNGASVGRVNKSLNTLNKNLGLAGNTASGTGKKIQGFAAGVAPTVNTANQAIGNLNQNLNDTGQAAEQTGRAIAGSFIGFRVLGAATNGLRQIKDLLLEAADASREFGQSVAEVQTIAGPSSGFGELRDSLRELSVEFGKPTTQQAEAAYQAFSNQVIQTTADMGFLADANTLAIASVSEVGDSVNLLSSVINSYQLSAQDAARINDVLFKGVEEGRFRIDEIANSFGTVSTLGAQAGVTFEELTAGLATITKTGTTAAVAQTQLRGVLAKLLKPTELMSDAFAEFGVKDGPAAIKAFGGLGPLIQKLQQFADKSGVSLLQLFGRIRGGQGALALAANEGQNFAEILDSVSNSAGSAEEALRKINQTDARQAEIAFNELKVTLEELGDAVVPVITKLVQGINQIIPDATTLGILLTGLTATLGLAAVAAGVFIVAMLPLGAIAASLAPFAPALLAVGAAFAGVVTATGLAILAAREFNAEIKKGIDAQTEFSRKAAEGAKERVRIQKETVETLKQAEKDLTEQIEKEFGNQLDAARQHNSKLVKEFQSSADQFVKSREAAVKELQKLAKQAGKIADDANKRVRTNQQKLDDVKFDKSIKGFDDVRKGARQLQRGLETARKARQELAKAGLDEEKIRAALETRRRAEEQLAAAERTAAGTENLTLQRQIADAQEKVLKDSIAQDKKLGKRAGKVSETAAEKAAKAVEESSAFARVEMTEIIRLASSFDQTGKPKSVKQMGEDMQEARKALKRLSDEATKDPTGGLATEAGIDLKGPGREAVSAAVDFTKQQGRIRKSLQNVLDSAPFQAKAQVTEQRQGAEATLKTVIDDAEIAGLQAKLDRQLATQNLTVPISPDTSAFEQGAQIIAGGLLQLVTDIDIARNAAGAFGQKMQEVTQNVKNLDQAGVDNAQKAVADAQKTLESLQKNEQIGAGDARAAQAQIDQASQILATREEILKKEASAAKAAAADIPAKVKEGTSAVKELGTAAQTTGTKVKGIGTSAQAGAGQLATASSSAIGRLRAVGAAADVTARKVQAALSGGGGGAIPAFFGRRIQHRQTGGFTRGQDRILTSTAPGEFVTNAAATRRFRAELTAINAGQQPQFRETGGSVTNVGDINVNISTQDATDIEGRSIARELKRELRTRTSSL
jgi:TP901 family phage tail tape measure protein